MTRHHLESSTRRRLLSALPLLAAVVPMIGCSAGAPNSEDSNANDSALSGPGYGIDYAWARPSPATIKADGYEFVCRYLSYDTTGKNLTKGEADELQAAGLDIVSNWEWGAEDSLDGYSRGVEEAQTAAAQAAAAGMPGDRPIYFSIDFDAQPSQQGAINAYFDGVASVLGRARTGAYGGYGVISRLFDDGKIAWAWQTYAWSYGQWDSRAHLRQIENDVGPGGSDKDQSMTADFGQWGPGSAPPPAPGPPTAKPAAPSGCGTIKPGQGLVAGETFSSCDGRFTLAMQTDGNLVLYRNGAGAMWSSNTYKSDGYVAVMQGDGNFVLYGHTSNALWSSRTNGHDGSFLAIQDDGNGVVHDGSKALWATGTNLPAPPPAPTGCGTIKPGEGLTAGESFTSCGGTYTLAMQTDGNLVLYHNGKGALWATGTNGKDGYNMWMQGDGNFVLYDTKGHALWSSGTNGHDGAFLAVQTDGNLVVYEGSKAEWDSGTNGR